jgi:RNA polymerase sigma-70 factor (ECF subfamily)
LDAQRDLIALDAAVMRAIASGDSDAFAALMHREGPRLARLANSLLANESEVEEVLQDAYVKLWRMAERWQASARIGTFLHTIVYRACIDRLRKHRQLVDISTIEDTLADSQPDAEALVLAQDRDAQLRQAVDCLTPRQRAAVTLAYHEELSQADASTVLGLTQEAYESLLARARRRLRLLLSETKGEGDDDA